MAHYRIDTKVAPEGLTLLKGHEEAIVSLGLGAGGEFLLESKEPLPDIVGLVELSDEQAEAARTKVAAPRISVKPSLAGVATLERAKDWTTESCSPRRADLSLATSRPGVPVLRVDFGAGRGDRMYVGRSLQIPDGARTLTVKAQARYSGDDSVSMGAVFTTDRERPWLEAEPQPLRRGVWETLSFDLEQFDEKKLARTDRLVLALITDADEGHVLIERVLLSE